MQVMFLDSLFYSEQRICFKYFNTTYRLNATNFTGSRWFIGQPNRRGTVTVSVHWRGGVDQRIVHPGSLNRSDQVCCSKYLDPAYGQFNWFSEVLILLKNQFNYYNKEIFYFILGLSLTTVNDMWGQRGQINGFKVGPACHWPVPRFIEKWLSLECY